MTQSWQHRRRLLCFVGWWIMPTIVGAQQAPQRRARPPQWERLDAAIFFEDAFRDGLRGERPATFNAARRAPPATNRPPVSPTDESGVVERRWRDLISAATLEDELKAIKASMDQALRTEGDFKAQGHQDLRVHLATAAILWAIIDQYDGPVRWQDDAAIMRDRCARLAQQAKAGSSQVYREATKLRQDLDDLIRGGRLSTERQDLAWSWPEIADRSLMMKRLEMAVQQDLAGGLASGRQLQQQQSRLLREAELVAAMAQVLTAVEMPDAADADYESIGDQLRQAAVELREGLQNDDLPQARRAHADAQRSCVACHELYRA